MKKCLLLLAALSLFGAGCAPYSAPAPAEPAAQAPAPSQNMPVKGAPAPKPVTYKVSIIDNAFEPQQIAVKPGDTVVWTNTGKMNHTVTGLDNVLAWDSGNLAPGQTFSRTFDNPGVYKYHCNIHPSMTAEVIVGEVQPQTK